jgi:hypothetical protein
MGFQQGSVVRCGGGGGGDWEHAWCFSGGDLSAVRSTASTRSMGSGKYPLRLAAARPRRWVHMRCWLRAPTARTIAGMSGSSARFCFVVTVVRETSNPRSERSRAPSRARSKVPVPRIGSLVAAVAPSIEIWKRIRSRSSSPDVIAAWGPDVTPAWWGFR